MTAGRAAFAPVPDEPISQAVVCGIGSARARPGLPRQRPSAGADPRRAQRAALIAERRIEFHKLGRHVRISEAVLAEFIKAGRVPAVTSARRRVA